MEEGILRRLVNSAWVLGAAAAVVIGCGGASVPPVTLVSLEELQVRLQSPRQQPLLLVFWATWCKPCVEEIPDLAAMQAREDLEILGISLDAFLHTPEKSLDLVAEQNRKTPMPYENLVFVGGQDAIFRAFDLPGGIPYALLFDAQGRLLQRFNGRVDPGVVTEVLANQTH